MTETACLPRPSHDFNTGAFFAHFHFLALQLYSQIFIISVQVFF